MHISNQSSYERFTQIYAKVCILEIFEDGNEFDKIILPHNSNRKYMETEYKN